MAATKPNSTSSFGEELEDDSFWLKVVEECLENPITKLPPGKRLLVLGDNDAEKTLLISKLQGGPHDTNFKKGNGLEFKYLTVKDEYCDNQTKLGVWILDEDPFYKPMLKYALDRKSLGDTIVLLVASMTKPWDIFDTIASWTEVLREHIDKLDLSESEMELRKIKILDRFREYIEPGLSIYGSLAADNTRELQFNLGIEMIVVITRTEYMKELRTEFGYEEEHFDFLQFTLRQFCLSYGSALFYVSVKEDRNCDFLLKYLLHKSYSFPFRIPGVLVEPDAILVPAGWDTKNKIKFLSDGIPTIPTSTPFEEVVFKPSRLGDIKRISAEVVALGDQEFLAELQAAADRQTTEERASDSSKDNSSSMTATVVQRNVVRRMTRAQAGRSPQKKMEEKLAAAGDNTLSNFFHSLLNRRTSAPIDRPLGLSGTRTFVPKNIPENLMTSSSSNQEKRDTGINDQEIAQNTPLSSIPANQNFLDESGGEKTEQSSQLKINNTEHLSIDQDKEMHQLPEYFLSNLEEGPCADDCSFPLPSGKSSSLDLDEQFSPPLDRVNSSFNPPLKLLLQQNGSQSRETPQNEVKNGDVSKNGSVFHVTHEPNEFPATFSGDSDSVMLSLPCHLDCFDET